MILPPNLNSLHCCSFGLLRLHLHSHSFSHANPLFSYRFLGQLEDKTMPIHTPVSYDIFCSLWHFHMYLLDMTNFIINISVQNKEIGRATIDLRKLIPRKLTNNVRNLINDRRKHEIEQDGQIIGTLDLSIQTVFDDKLIQLCRPIAERMMEMPEGDSILDIMGDIDMPMLKTPRPIDKSPEPIPYTKAQPIQYTRPQPIQSNIPVQMSIDEQSRMISDDIDRMVAELESKQYDSSKYQDEETLGSLMTHKQPVIIKPKMMASEYSIGKGSSTHYEMMSTKAIGMEMPNTRPSLVVPGLVIPSAIPPTIQSTLSLSQTSQKHTAVQKILKVQIFELSFASAAFNSQILSSLSTAKLSMTLPNQQQLSFVGRIHGQTVSYNCKNVEIETVMTTSSTGTTLFNSHQPIIFTIIEPYTLNQLSYGTFDLQRLIRADNKGVFVINMNNRQKAHALKTTTLSFPSSEMHKLKPVNASLYSLRVGMQLESTTKNKLYQLLLEIKELNPQYRIRYKMYGSQETVEADSYHIMVMPVMLDTILQDKNGKIIVQVWNRESLLGLIDISLSQIQKCLVRQDGKYDESALLASIYPLYLCKGKQDIKHIITKKTEGTLEMSVCFGSPKQIGLVVKERNKVVEAVVEQKKMVLPYDEKMGVFVKQKGKQVEVQVEIEQKHEEKPLKFEVQKSNQFEEPQNISRLPEPQMISEQSVVQQPRHIETAPTLISPVTNLEAIQATTPPMTLTNQLINKISHLIQNILTINPQFIEDLKKHIQKYLLFSFIEQSTLIQCLHSVHLSSDMASELMAYLPITVGSSMLSVNPLYDYFTCYSIHQTILEKFISDDTLGLWILEQYASQDGHYVTDIEDVRHLTLREKELFWKIYSKIVKNEQQWEKYKIDCLERQLQQQQKTNMKQEQDNKILDAIYAICQDQSFAKHNILNITIKGYDNCIDSAKCLLGIQTEICSIRFTIGTDCADFMEDTSQEIPIGTGREWFQHRQAFVELYCNGILICSLVVQLDRLVFQDIDGTYAMKTKDGSFCGLIRLSLQYVQ